MDFVGVVFHRAKHLMYKCMSLLMRPLHSRDQKQSSSVSRDRLDRSLSVTCPLSVGSAGIIKKQLRLGL